MIATSWIPQVVVPFATLVLGAVLFHLFAKSRDARAARRAQYLKAYDVVRDSLDQYQEWLFRLRRLVDPFDRRGLGGCEDLAKRKEASWYVSEIDGLESSSDSGRRMVKSLKESQKVLRIIDDAFLDTLDSLVEGVQEYWRNLMQTRTGEHQGDAETLTWILSRDSLGRGELEAEEVFQAETIVTDLCDHLRRDHNVRVHGDKAVGDAASSRPLIVRDGRLAYDGPLPFESEGYLAAKDAWPWEREAAGGPEPL